MPERVVITGASRGLGLELARRHAARGDSVLATCRDPGSAKALAALAKRDGSLRVERLDHASPATITAAAQAARTWLGIVDLLWTNAGIYPGSPGTSVEEGPIGTLRLEDGLEVFATNAVGAILVAQAFLPLLRASRRPRILALSSGYGSLALNRGTPYWYGASKAALNMLHRSLAADPDLGEVSVVVVSPGWTKTDMGGRQAPTPVAECVDGLLHLADRVGPAESGSFLDWRGAVVPW